MLKIGTERNDGKLTVTPEGRLDTTTSPELEAVLKDNYEGLQELVFDMASLEYISSAGLRVLLAAQRVMNKQGTMIVRNINEAIEEIFEVTGFSEILTVEKK